MPVGDPLKLLRIHVETGFVLIGGGRFDHEAAPDRSLGPRFRIEGCSAGNVAVVRSDVPEDTARELLRLADNEPPFASPEGLPVHLAAYLELLAAGSDAPVYNLGLNWVFGSDVAFDAPIALVHSGTSRAEVLAGQIPEVMDPSLVGMGFHSSDDLWAPWVVAVDAGKIVSIAETVRRGPVGAEVGVDTAVDHRGRGLGAAVTAAWAMHIDLRGLTLFYGTSRANTSSRRLVDRLGLKFLGSSLGVD